MIAASTSALNSPTDEDVVHYGQDLAGNGPSSMTNVAASPTAHLRKNTIVLSVAGLSAVAALVGRGLCRTDVARTSARRAYPESRFGAGALESAYSQWRPYSF